VLYFFRGPPTPAAEKTKSCSVPVVAASSKENARKEERKRTIQDRLEAEEEDDLPLSPNINARQRIHFRRLQDISDTEIDPDALFEELMNL